MNHLITAAIVGAIAYGLGVQDGRLAECRMRWADVGDAPRTWQVCAERHGKPSVVAYWVSR